MVSIVLLTTEEVLQKNVYWYCLDSEWVTEEMEPFEEVKQEHMFIKPLSRDFYYAKYPDIPRSESDDENSLSLHGFKSKHREWKSKICVKKFDAQRRNLSQLSSSSGRNETRRVTSIVESRNNEKILIAKKNKNPNNDKKVLDFLRRIHESVPPPPIEDLQHSRDISSGSLECPIKIVDFNEVELPEYDDFVNDKIRQTELEEDSLPKTSTLKKTKRKVSFNFKKSSNDFNSDQSWYDSIYGLSDLVLWTSDNDIIQSDDPNNIVSTNDIDPDMVDYFPSWSEILIECNVKDDSILRSKESLPLREIVISCSNTIPDIADIDFEEADSKEAEYARFAIYKIHQTLKIQGDGMLDSSSMIDLTETEDTLFNKIPKGSSFFGTVYRLAPSPMDDVRG